MFSNIFTKKNNQNLPVLLLLFAFLVGLLLVAPVFSCSSPSPTLSVVLQAIPDSGYAPLNDVDLKATLTGTAEGKIDYKFDCTNDDVWDYEISETLDNPKTITDACDYSLPGTYTAKVYAKRDTADIAYGTTTITVSSRPLPTVDIKADGSDGPKTVDYGQSVLLSWESTNTDYCEASGGWSGTKGTSGIESTGSLVASKTYLITCTGPGGIADDSVVVNVSSANRTPSANAGLDKEVFESESVTLQGSGSDPDGDSITYSWYCNGGSLSSSFLAQPIFYAPFVSGDKEYTCTLTVTDSRGASDSDSMRVLVKDRESATLSVSLSAEPSSGCAPLKDVDLKTNVSGTATGMAAFLFDCENNGTWEKIHTENTNSYTAYNLCSYFLADDYEAKVKVERGGLSAIDTVTIKARSCQDDDALFDVSKRAKNQTKGQSSWYESITAVPADKVIFEIKITSTSDEKVYDLVVKDTLPEKIAWYGNLKIDDKDSSKNITEGVNIGDLDPGKSKTLTFEVLIAQSADFSYGSTALINTVLVFNEQAADTDTAKVTVTKTSVAGSVTDVPAGVLSSAKISLLIVIFFVFLASYFFLLKFYISEKTPGLNFGTLLSETKERARDFFSGLYLSPQEKSKVQLSQAIAAIKKQEKIE